MFDDKGSRWSRFGTINLDTGEIMEGVPVYVGAKVKWREGWFMTFQEALIELAKDREFTGETYRVLFFLMGNLGFENFITIQQKQVAEEIGLRKEHVSRAVKFLIEKGIVSEGPKLGRTRSLKLNSHFGWKGKILNLSKERMKLIHPQSQTEKPV